MSSTLTVGEVLVSLDLRCLPNWGVRSGTREVMSGETRRMGWDLSRTWALDVANDAAVGVVHELNADLGDTTTGA